MIFEESAKPIYILLMCATYWILLSVNEICNIIRDYCLPDSSYFSEVFWRTKRWGHGTIRKIIFKAMRDGDMYILKNIQDTVLRVVPFGEEGKEYFRGTGLTKGSINLSISLLMSDLGTSHTMFHIALASPISTIEWYIETFSDRIGLDNVCMVLSNLRRMEPRYSGIEYRYYCDGTYNSHHRWECYIKYGEDILLHRHLPIVKRCSAPRMDDDVILRRCINMNLQLLNPFLPTHQSKIIRLLENERFSNRDRVIEILRARKVDCSGIRYPYCREQSCLRWEDVKSIYHSRSISLALQERDEKVLREAVESKDTCELFWKLVQSDLENNIRILSSLPILGIFFIRLALDHFRMKKLIGRKRIIFNASIHLEMNAKVLDWIVKRHGRFCKEIGRAVEFLFLSPCLYSRSNVLALSVVRGMGSIWSIKFLMDTEVNLTVFEMAARRSQEDINWFLNSLEGDHWRQDERISIALRSLPGTLDSTSSIITVDSPEVIWYNLERLKKE